MLSVRSAGRHARPLMKPLVYAFSFVLPVFLVVAVWFATPVVAALSQHGLQAPAHDQPLPDRPPHDPTKRTALIVAGNTATESSDLLGPYEVLATSGEFNVYVVAPERRLTPLIPLPHCCGPMDLMPHYSFAEYDQVIGADPDLVVVPYIPFASTQDAAVLSWLRERPGEQTVILSICRGAEMVANAGLLAGRQATSHQTTLQGVRKSHPEVNWVTGLRYVEDGRFISSAGVTSGVDATLHAVRRFFGEDAALETAHRMGYPHACFLSDPTWQFAPIEAASPIPNAFRFNRSQIGVLLYDGVREIAVSSIIDTYPRSTATDVQTIGVDRAFVRTRHGLDLLSRFDLASAPSLDRVLIPGTPDAALGAEVDAWAAARGQSALRIHASGAYPYDVTFADMARQETRPIAEYAAAWLEYPVASLDLGGIRWRPELVLRAVVLGALGVGVTWTASRLRRTRRPLAALPT